MLQYWLFNLCGCVCLWKVFLMIIRAAHTLSIYGINEITYRCNWCPKKNNLEHSQRAPFAQRDQVSLDQCETWHHLQLGIRPRSVPPCPWFACNFHHTHMSAGLFDLACWDWFPKAAKSFKVKFEESRFLRPRRADWEIIPNQF